MTEGLVTKKMANQFWVKTQNSLFLCSARGNLKDDGVFVGDKVEIDETTASIENVLPRKNKLIRPPIVNLQQLLILIADKPAPDFLMLDKLILFCKVYDIEPVVCFAKTDISNKHLIYLEKVYSKFFKVLNFSSKTGENIEKVREVLNGKVSAFAGQSGVGKSALINAIFGVEKSTEGVLSSRILRGKNTTRHTELFEVSSGSFVADTAGFSSLNEKLLPINEKELPYYYPDFLEFLPQCEYKSCVHINEKKCGIKTAVSSGEIDKLRYSRYVEIYNSLKENKKY